jgi:O-antigen/teichoic acid export membrane protein
MDGTEESGGSGPAVGDGDGAVVVPRDGSARDGAAPPSLRALAVRGSAWTVLGYGGMQLIRLGGNLVTTRLLVPEHFGIMALVAVALQAMEMFSDLGINTNIIQSRRGDDRRFLDTAFTIQVLRGGALWLIVCLVAWPLSVFYAEPMLLAVLPVAGLNAVLLGFTNTSLATHGRHLVLGRLTILDVVSAVVQVGVMIGLALVWRSVWPLVIGGLVGSALRLAASHTVLAAYRNRFRWDADAARSLVRFGRWILVSSVLGFFVNRGDIVVIGKFVPIGLLGVFHIGSQFAQSVRQLHFKLAGTVVYPVLVKLGDQPSDELRRKVRLVRLGVMMLMLPPLWFFVVLGPQFIGWLYDDRYWLAGDMLQVLAVGGIFTIVPDVGPIYLARGNSLLFMITLLVRSTLLLGCMLAGAALAGMWGLLFGIAASAALYYPVQVAICRAYRVWLPELDLLGFAASAAVVGLGWWLEATL